MKGFIDYYGEKFFFTGAAHNTVHYIEQGNVKQFCKIDKEKSATITNIFVKYKENSNETTKMTANYSIPEAIMVSLKIEDKTLNHEEHRIQFFSLQGKFIEEIVIPNYYSKEDPFTNHSIKPDHKMWWDKKENVLYMLCNIKNPDKDDYDFFILQYLISSK